MTPRDWTCCTTCPKINDRRLRASREQKATAPCRADAVAFALFRFRSRHNRKTQAEGFADFGDSVKRDIHTSFFDTTKVAGIKVAAVEAAPGPKKESDE